MTYNEPEEWNQFSVGTLLTPVETSRTWQRCGLMDVRRLNLDLHNHRYRTASSLPGTRSWCKTCFHNSGRLYSLWGTDQGRRNSWATSMQHNITQPGGGTSVEEISTTVAAIISRRAMAEAVQWRADVMRVPLFNCVCVKILARGLWKMWVLFE
jgi:hypothetical protein